ncbi:PUA-like domain-containing protein [Crassisporium funariophilum]|nr:PUA-like domain-containing protein [Crassisporium funariophilum]
MAPITPLLLILISLSNAQQMLAPSQLQPFLLCPLCDQPLAAATTLHCGHTLCQHHLQQPSASCPVPHCTTTTPPTAIHPQSTVQYSVAPTLHTHPPPVDHRADVTVNKIIALLHRTNARLDPHPLSDHSHPNSPDSSPRPRKRHKRRHSTPPQDDEDSDTDLLTHLRNAAALERSIPHDVPIIPEHPTPDRAREQILTEFDKKLLEELTCHICYVLFHQPITTPCQHTFCAKCLQRSLDYATTCPVCRQELPTFAYFQDHPVNKSIMAIILKAYHPLYQERATAIEQEERNARLKTPIFVCQLSFPGIPTVIHFFEPRYRLMLRRCLEMPQPYFGMVMQAKPGNPPMDYGTILEIRRVQMLPDGRSVVEVRGAHRFRILERGQLDGYTVGRVEWIFDYPDDHTQTLVMDELEEEEEDEAPSVPPSEPPSESTSSDSPSSDSPSSPDSSPDDTEEAPSSTSFNITMPRRRRQPSNAELMLTCTEFLDRLRRGAAPWVVTRLSDTYGPIPTDPALFAFWVALVLPIDEHEKAKLLPIKSVRLRLMLVVHWIEQLNNKWYAWLRFVVVDGWIVGGPAGPCLVWIAFVLTVSRFVGWI